MTTEQEAPARSAVTRPPPWRDIRVLRVVLQVAFVLAVAALLWWLYDNLVTNLRATRIRTDFGFLSQPAGFTLGGTDFRSTEPIWKAILVGLLTTVRISAVGIALATVLGVVVGVARLSTNWLVARSAAGFVEALRNVPLIVLLVFLYFAVLQQLPRVSDAYEPLGLIVMSNRGLYVPWVETAEGAGEFWIAAAAAALLAAAVWIWRTRRFDATGQPHHRVLWGGGVFLALTTVAWLLLGRPVSASMPTRTERLVAGGYELSPEYGALLIGLTIYTAAFIAEIVRGSILAVPKGQTEAANALGLSSWQRLRFVILPQALRVAVPPTGNEFLNLAKNSSLGVVIAVPELLRVIQITIGQGQPAPQLIGIMMALYLGISLALSAGTNLLNRRMRARGG